MPLLPSILGNALLCFFVAIANFPFTEALACYSNFHGRTVIDSTGRSCFVYYGFNRTEGEKIVRYKGWFHAGNEAAPEVFCLIYDDGDPNKPRAVKDEASIARIKIGGVFCFCGSAPVCNTKPETYRNYVNSRGPQERRILEYFLTIDVPDAEEMLEKFQATSSTTSTTTTTTSSTTTTTTFTTTSTTTFTTTTARATTSEDHEDDDDSEGSSGTLLLVGIGVFCVLVIGGVIALPYLHKVRKEQHKKWLERTWDERVRQAALELQTQSDTKVRPRRRRLSVDGGSRDKSKEASLEAGSKEKVGSKEFGSKEKIGSKEAGSLERVGSFEKKGSKEGIGDDPFGDFVSKMGRMDQQHGGQMGRGHP